jgi:hypothetical protein
MMLNMRWSIRSLAVSMMGFYLFSPLPSYGISPNDEKTIEDNFAVLAKEPGSVTFMPPNGWLLADSKALPSSVKIMVVGKGKTSFPPSINLATEPYTGTLKQYLKTVKAINDSKGSEWKDLGTIKTEAGNASLSQVDSKTEWGEVRMMHVILLKHGTVYILTAASSKDEFPQFYKEFFNSLKSLKINKSVFEMVENAQKRAKLENATAALKQAWQDIYTKLENSSQESSKVDFAKAAFENQEFQQNQWVPFKTMLSQDFPEMNNSWRIYLINKLQNELSS